MSFLQLQAPKRKLLYIFSKRKCFSKIKSELNSKLKWKFLGTEEKGHSTKFWSFRITFLQSKLEIRIASSIFGKMQRSKLLKWPPFNMKLILAKLHLRELQWKLRLARFPVSTKWSRCYNWYNQTGKKEILS